MQEEYTKEIHEVRTRLIKEEKKNKIIEERIGEMIVMNKHLSKELEELENRQRRKGIETKDNSTQTIIENETKMTYKIIKNNNMIKFENLTDIEIIAIYYITTMRYFDEIPDNFDIKWKSDIDYKKQKNVVLKPEDIIKKEKNVTIKIRKDDKSIIVFKINIKEKTFSVQGELIYKWEEYEEIRMEEIVNCYIKEQNITKMKELSKVGGHGR